MKPGLDDKRATRRSQAAAANLAARVLSFDATDVSIIRELRANGRANNQQIAEKLGLT
ncbi:AsnC-type helix-turn-helix domain-containing protein, partial [Novosphingobium aromaticivorans]